MIREIIVNNIKIQYNLQIKNVKNINLRIKPNGTINVSANKNVPQKNIDEFIISKADFILRALEKYKNRTEADKKQYFSENEIKEYILAFCEKVYPYYESLGIKFPQIKFRKMVSCWGNCRTKKGILTFNTNLMYATRECVKYVVYHEFTHFLQPNHSGKFYDELVKVCPDWKACRKKLKETNIMIKVAIVGVGGMGTGHFNIYNDMEDVELIAACDVRVDMLKEKVGDRNIKVYADFDEMSKNEKPDMIDISTPSYLHMDYAIKALESGFHVICEKPMTLNGEQADKVLAAAEKSKKLFMVAHVVRFLSDYKYLKSVFDSGKLGKLLRLDMKRISAIPKWSFENWMQEKNKSGLVMLDLMIHDVDFMQYMLGMPKDIQGVYHELRNMNDFAEVNYIYDDCLVSIEGTWYDTDIPFNASYLAVFEKGYVKCDGGVLIQNGEKIDRDTAAEKEDTGINLTSWDGYAGEIRYFIDCINNGIKPQFVTPESSAASVKLIDETRKKVVRL